MQVTIPNMKAAIMVALLFRTLDAFRVFDNVFVMTAGANGTETVSFLAYRQTIGRAGDRPGLGGLGPAVPRRGADRRACFIKGFKVDLSQRKGEPESTQREGPSG